MISTSFLAMEKELKRDSELLFFLGKWGNSLWQARSHNLVDIRALPHARQLSLCPQALGSESGGMGTLEKHTLGQPHQSGVAVPTRHPAPASPEGIGCNATFT